MHVRYEQFRSMRLPRWLLGAKVALAGLLLCGAIFPQVGGFAGKGMAFRLPLFLAPALIVPVRQWLRRRTQSDSANRTYPWALDAALTLPFLFDTFGNAVGLYDNVNATDDVLHFVNWVVLIGGITAAIGYSSTSNSTPSDVSTGTPSTMTPRWLVWWAGTGMGSMAIIGWEVGEYLVMQAGVGGLALTYGDTMGDLVLSSAGGALGAWVVTAWGHPISGAGDS